MRFEMDEKQLTSIIANIEEIEKQLASYSQ